MGSTDCPSRLAPRGSFARGTVRRANWIFPPRFALRGSFTLGTALPAHAHSSASLSIRVRPVFASTTR
jgi:hypothetical protein